MDIAGQNNYAWFEREASLSRASFALTHAAQLPQEESAAYLDANALGALIAPQRAVNRAHPRWQQAAERTYFGPAQRVNLLAAGNVGAMLLLGLRLLGGESVSQLGLYDIDQQNCARWEFELNQVCGPETDRLPPLRVLNREQLFDADVFVFCASAGVPPVGSGGDVRMQQYKRNAAIISEYARQARSCGFSGLFAVVSDPVDLLCRSAFAASNQDAQGRFDGLGLLPEQIEGFGLGVMYARARYYAERDPRLAEFLRAGRVYGPHGVGLLAATATADGGYDDALSQELTALTVEANLRAREIGFKPYVAPAFSSGALSLLAALRGQWHYSSTFMHGIFMGARNRRTAFGLELEALPLDRRLRERLEQTAAYLAKQEVLA